MPNKNLKTIQSKQDKESVRKKSREGIIKNNKKPELPKKLSKPKKEYHKEFKRLMNIYSDASKLVNADSLDDLKLAKDELLHHLSLKLEKSYSYAFIYIRQLAITLRQTIGDSKKSSVYSVYNWQYLKNVELWTDFIVDNSGSSDLIKSLIQPMVQLIGGVIRLRPSARWLPIRFHLLKYLNQISRSCENLTPVLANIMEIFNSVNFNQKTKRDSKKTINLMVMLHFSTSQLGTFEHLEQSLDQIFQLIIENLSVYCQSPSFPEYAVYLISTIRAFCKSCRESMFRKAYRSLVKKIDEHSKFIRKQRLSHPTQLKLDANPIFEKFLESYRLARLSELEMIMKATRHAKFALPQDDYEDKEKNFDEEEAGETGAGDDGEESSVLDEDEFNQDSDEQGFESTVEIE